MHTIIKRKKCRLCESNKLTRVLNLCNSPLANNLALSKQSSLKAKYYPLNLMLCTKCKHVQLEHVVNAVKLYNNYFYMTGISNQFKLHFKNYTKNILKLFNKSFSLKVLEIGSNDCTLLDFLKEKNCITVGIEPAKNLSKIKKNQHKIYNCFYNKKINEKLLKKYKNFDIIIANNVFAHIDDLKKVFVLLKSLINDQSLIIFEVSYLLDVIKKKLFDTIYHEHLDYHSIAPLIPFFNKIGLKIINIKKISTHGGSVRIYLTNNFSTRLVDSKKIKSFILKEKKCEIDKRSTFIKFYKNIENEKIKLKSFFNKIKNERVYGYGAPAKAVTLINYFNINHENINLIVDDSKLKQNKYIPGSQISITNSKVLNSKPPKYIIIFAWNVYKDILIKLKKFDKIEYAVIPLPKFKLIKL